MAWTGRKLAEHFALPVEVVGEFIRRNNLGSSPDATLMLSPEEEYHVVGAVSRAGAQCRSCKSDFQAGQRQCRCGRELGRCSRCERHTSFSRTKKCWIARDEYKCDACGAACANCNYGKARRCYRWAPYTEGVWKGLCLECEFDPQRIDDEREQRRRTHEAAMQGVAFAQARRAAQDEANNRLFFEMFDKRR